MHGVSGDFGLDVLHLENEISVILTALGYAYAGKKAAVGTSGGGFCLMTEGLSLAGMAEVPIVIVLGQRTGPSTGLPTYSGQSDLLFALHAGQARIPPFSGGAGRCGRGLLLVGTGPEDQLGVPDPHHHPFR